MPIQGRSLGDVGRIFRDYLNDLLHTTITPMPLSLERGNEEINLRFRGMVGQSGGAPLKTNYGELELYLNQLCTAERDKSGAYTLHTVLYRYAISRSDANEALLRWEYIRDREPGKFYCRHHLQGPITLDLYHQRSREQVNLQAWHLPTGWVPIEEVLRFCIVDLGVTPLSNNWDRILVDSERRFRSEFSSPGE